MILQGNRVRKSSEISQLFAHADALEQCPWRNLFGAKTDTQQTWTLHTFVPISVAKKLKVRIYNIILKRIIYESFIFENAE